MSYIIIQDRQGVFWLQDTNPETLNPLSCPRHKRADCEARLAQIEANERKKEAERMSK